MAFRDAAKARHNLPRRTVPALEAFMFDKGLLKGMQILAGRDSLYCGDLSDIVHH